MKQREGGKRKSDIDIQRERERDTGVRGKCEYESQREEGEELDKERRA